MREAGVIARRYAPLTAEHRFWVRAVPRVLAPTELGPVMRWLHRVLVVPNVVFISGSAEYQAYLAMIFHRSLVARLGHFVCVPLGIALFVATCARIHPAIGGAVVAILAVWWALVALLHRRFLWAALNVVVAVLLGAVGLVASRWVSMPWLAMIVVAALQSASHATESHVPPRVGHPVRWMPVAEFIRRDGSAAAVAQWLYGAFDEWWATPRLVHVGTLLLLFRFGYAPDLRERLDGYVGRAIASGEPALDYIGEGGGSYLDPATLDPRETA